MGIILPKPGDRGNLGDFAEFQRFPRSAPDTTGVDMATPVLRKSLMPASGRLGKDAPPGESALEQPTVAQVITIRGPEFHEETSALETQFAQHKEILSQLRRGVAEKRQSVPGHGRVQGRQEGQVSPHPLFGLL